MLISFSEIKMHNLKSTLYLLQYLPGLITIIISTQS